MKRKIQVYSKDPYKLREPNNAALLISNTVLRILAISPQGLGDTEPDNSVPQPKPISSRSILLFTHLTIFSLPVLTASTAQSHGELEGQFSEANRCVWLCLLSLATASGSLHGSKAIPQLRPRFIGTMNYIQASSLH